MKDDNFDLVIVRVLITAVNDAASLFLHDSDQKYKLEWKKWLYYHMSGAACWSLNTVWPDCFSVANFELVASIFGFNYIKFVLLSLTDMCSACVVFGLINLDCCISIQVKVIWNEVPRKNLGHLKKPKFFQCSCSSLQVCKHLDLLK